MPNEALTLDKLIQGLPVVATEGDLSSIRVRRITCDSRQVQRGDLFAAVPGTTLDGHDYIPQALKAGAGAVLVSRITPECLQAPAVIQVPNIRVCMGQIAGRLFGHPDHEIETIAITGTNGKTTISYILEAILKAAGARPGVVGTVNYRFNDMIHPAATTTPESIDLFELLAKMKEKKATHMVVEVSSHALDQHRVAGLCFSGAIFTNLSRDHLDYHHSMEPYFQAKQRLFTDVLPGRWESDRPANRPVGPAAINIDDSYGRRIVEEYKGPVITFGIRNDQAQVRAGDIQLDKQATRFQIRGSALDLSIRSSLLGRHNVSNLLAAAAMAHALGISHPDIQAGIENLAAVPGRLEALTNDQGRTILVDYAHTPDALNHAIHTCRELLRDGRLIVIFGAGGNRDRGKRPLMGEVAAGNADLAVITSDNPRTEDPLAIIREIIPGAKKAGAAEINTLNPTVKGYLVEPDRRKAINLAITAARHEDIVLIAGKGHEDYQIIGTTKHPFDDRRIAAQALAAQQATDP